MLVTIQQYKPGGVARLRLVGGAASTTDGHFIALGNMEELLREITLGVPSRGDGGDRPLTPRRRARAASRRAMATTLTPWPRAQ